MFLLIRHFTYGLEKIRTDLYALGLMVRVILMDFEPYVRKTKSSNKLSIGRREHGVGGHPSDSFIGTKVTSGVELMNCSIVKIMLEFKWCSKI